MCASSVRAAISTKSVQVGIRSVTKSCTLQLNEERERSNHYTFHVTGVPESGTHVINFGFTAPIPDDRFDKPPRDIDSG